MTRFVAKRLLSAFAVVLVLTVILFVLQKASHTNPVHAILGPNASQSAIRAETIRLGLNRPLLEQFFSYLGGLTHLNLGTSYRTRRPVATDLAQYLPATLELATAAFVMALGLGAAFGLLSVRGGVFTKIFRAVILLGASTPGYLIAFAGLIILYNHLHLLPATGEAGSGQRFQSGFVIFDDLFHGDFTGAWDGVVHVALPALSIALVPAVSIGRVFRSSLESTLRSDYVRTARAKGMSETRVLALHSIRNSLGPALTMTGLQLGLMFAGVAVVEDIFAWPGIGYYTTQSIPVSDFPAIAGVTLVLGVGYVLINALVDIAQTLADPRIKL